MLRIELFVRSRLLPALVCMLIGTSLAACAAKPGAAIVDNNAADWTAPPPYILQPGDEVEVKFFYSPQLDEREVIRPDGLLTLPYLSHPVTAANLSVDQLRDNLIAEYSTFMVKPSVEVLLRTANANRVFVSGQVTQQTAIPVTGPTSLSSAISMAKGFKITAAKTSVLVIRQLQGGKTIARRIDFKKIADGSDTSQDIELAAGDLVYVPETYIGNVDDYVAQFRLALPIEASFGGSYSFGPATRTNH